MTNMDKLVIHSIECQRSIIEVIHFLCKNIVSILHL